MHTGGRRFLLMTTPPPVYVINSGNSVSSSTSLSFRDLQVLPEVNTPTRAHNLTSSGRFLCLTMMTLELKAEEADVSVLAEAAAQWGCC